MRMSMPVCVEISVCLVELSNEFPVFGAAWCRSHILCVSNHLNAVHGYGQE